MVCITDLSQCVPNSALSTEAAQGRWQVIPYETCDEEPGTGVMIGAASSVDAPEVRLPLNVSGWHSVYVGFWNLHYDYDMAGTRIRVKLDDDPAFIQIREPQPALDYGGTFLREAFFKTADLSGRELIFAKIGGPFAAKAYIAYVKLVPLGDEEVASLQEERSRMDTRILQGSIDGTSYLWGGEYKSKEQLLELVEEFRYSNVGKVIWACNYGDLTNYPSQLGTFLGEEPPVPIPAMLLSNTYIGGAKVRQETTNELASRGLIPQAVIGQHVHQMGLKFDAMYRLAINGHLPGERRVASKKGFVEAHPQFRQVSMHGVPIGQRHFPLEYPKVREVREHGVPVEKASYAYPEVRKFMLSIIQESMERFPFDGANLCFCRGPQFMLYEEPVLEDFRKEFGEDGRGVPFDDPRMEKIRCRYLTEFVRDTRRLLDEVGRNKGKRLELSAMVWRKTEVNLLHGFDVETWIGERLLDSVLLLNGYGTNPISPQIVDVAKANECETICFVGASQPDASAMARDLLMAYEVGVDGFGAWDMDGDGVFQKWSWWDVWSKVGDRKALESLTEKPSPPKTIRLKTVGGCDVLDLAVYSGG